MIKKREGKFEMPVIHIYGASGSGTSTLGKALHERYGYCHLDTDDYFWLPTDPPFTYKRPAAERIALLTEDIHKSSKTVISGSLCGWGDALLPLFDLVVRLVAPTQERLKRLNQREFQRFGSRICAGGDMYQGHMDFLQWAAGYDTGGVTMRSKAMHDRWQESVRCRHLTLDGTAQIQELLETISANVPMP